ncbi:DUF7064 domain-containing protein [Paracoccus sp. (in: a-proteobacteria)]
MITPDDADFHPRDPSDMSWTETTFLPFAVPEEGIFGNCYVLARPNLGICLSSVIVSRGICVHTYEIDFTDPQMHLKCPEKFSDFTLDNGLSLKALGGPQNYDLRYENQLGACSFDLSFRGLHRPFDPRDPAENPLLSQRPSGAEDPRIGKEWANGHFECKGHITGSLTLYGETYKVDCYEGMDHSWGPRKELGTRAVSWISINFGEDLAIHLAVPMRIEKGTVLYDPVQFGFVVENGEVYGVTSAEVQANRVHMQPIGNRITVTDIRGKSFEFLGTAVGGHPWHSFNPCHVCYQTTMRYTWNDRVGFGEFGDIFGLDYLARHMSRSAPWRRVPQSGGIV